MAALSGAAQEQPSDLPVLAGRTVELEPVSVLHYDALLPLLVEAERHQRWRLRGAVPSPERFVHVLWADVLAQFVLKQRASSAVSGLVQLHEVDLRNGHAQLSFIVASDLIAETWPFEAVLLAAEHAFTSWDLRKVYLQLMGDRGPALTLGQEALFRQEGTLRDHEYSDGQYHDLHQYAIYREAFLAWRTHFQSGPG